MKRLAAAFVATTYRVEAGGRYVDLRIGKRHPALDRCLLAEANMAGRKAPLAWAIVTACNPGGVLAAGNVERQAALAARVAGLGWRSLPVTNIADDANWVLEPALLLIDVGEDAALALATDFSQAAIVCGNIADRAALVWVEPQRR